MSFQHHAEVASLSAEDQDAWLDKAEALGWSLQALRVGRVQLRRIEELIARRAAIAAALNDALRDLPGVTLQPRPANAPSAHHLYTVFIEDEAQVDQLTLMGRLVEEGIQIQQRYFPLHLLSEWRRLGNDLGLCPVAEHTWFHRQLNLPIYPQMTDSQLSFMTDALVRNLGSR